MTRALAALLCGALALLLWRTDAPRVLTLPPPGRTVPTVQDTALQPFLAAMTADDLVRGLWAMDQAQPMDPTLRGQVAAALITRSRVEALREERRQARDAWLAASVPLMECR